jgi:pimeloyl-ACP methyl ester carboxylesterase
MSWGWSTGGIVAQGVALAAPGPVNRLVVAGSSPGGVPGLPASSAPPARSTSSSAGDRRRGTRGAGARQAISSMWSSTQVRRWARGSATLRPSAVSSYSTCSGTAG